MYVGNLPGEEVLDMFKNFKLVGAVENEFARERGTKIFLLLDAQEDVTEMFYNLVEDRKKSFNIF